MPVDESNMDPSITEIEIEALRVLPIGKDEAIVGFKMEDADDTSNELSVFFKAKSFEKPTKLFAIDTAFRDVWLHEGELWAVDLRKVYRFTGAFKKPTSTELSIRPNAILGSSSDNIFAVGEGVAHFNGKKWTPLTTPKGFRELKCIVMHGEVAYAAGDGGVVVELTKDKVRLLKAPTKDTDLSTIYIDKKGVLSIGGKAIAVQGPADDLVAVKLPKNVAYVVGVSELSGKLYWSAVGDNDGFGLFVQTGKKLELLDARITGTLSSSEKHLYVGADSGALRYDGKDWKVLALDFDDDKEKWTLETRSLDEALEGNDDEDEEDEDDEDEE